MKNYLFLPLLSALVLAAPAAHARVKLVALPDRARVVVSLAHPEQTLVEEERVLTLQKGVNQVDFSWAGVNIDASSIQVRMLSHPDKVLLLNTSYPPNETALIWELSCPNSGEERVRISYLLAGLNRDIVYKAVAEPDEKMDQPSPAWPSTNAPTAWFRIFFRRSPSLETAAASSALADASSLSAWLMADWASSSRWLVESTLADKSWSALLTCESLAFSAFTLAALLAF